MSYFDFKESGVPTDEKKQIETKKLLIVSICMSDI